MTMQEVLKKIKSYDKLDRRFDRISRKLDFLIKKVSEQNDRLDWIEKNMITKADIKRVEKLLDELLTLCKTSYCLN